MVLSWSERSTYWFTSIKRTKIIRATKRLMMFHRFVEYTEVIFKIGTLLYSATVIAYLLYPLFMYFHANEIVPMLLVTVPFVDESTANGFMLLSGFHIVCLTMALAACASVDFSFTMIVANMLLISNIFDAAICDINLPIAMPLLLGDCGKPFRHFFPILLALP